MKIKIIVLLFVLSSVGFSAVKDSSDFPYKYESFVVPGSSGFTYSGTSPSSTYNTTDGDVLTNDTSTTGSYQSSYWYRTWTADTTAGYAVEVRLKVISSADTGTNINRGWWLSVGENGTGAILSFFDGSVKHRGASLSTIITASNTDAFHTYRIVVRPGGSYFDVYRDGSLVVINRATATVWEEIGFGDPTTATDCPDSKVQIDYIRWDPLGGYAPVSTVNTLNYDSTAESLKVDGYEVFGPHAASVGGQTGWTVSKSGSGDHYTITRTNVQTLEWKTYIDRVNSNVWEFTHNVKNNSGSAKSISNLQFSFDDGAYAYHRFTKAHADQWTKNIATETIDIGNRLGYVMLHDTNNDFQNAEIHFYMPEWLDTRGSLSTNTGGKVFSGTIFYDFDDNGNQVSYNLAAGATRTIKYRVGYFAATEAMLKDSETPIDMTDCYLYRWNAAKMLAMGYPLPEIADAYINMDKDSVNFANKYEGNVLPDSSGFTYGGATPASTYNSTNGSILTSKTNDTAGYQTSYWYRSWTANVTNGYSAEIRLKVVTSADSGTDINRGWWFVVGENSTGALLSIFDNSIKLRGSSLTNILYTGSNTDAFHTYRIVINPGGTTFDLYRDGILVIDDYATVNTLSYDLCFGDPTSSSACPDTKVDVDYIRWDVATMAYNPLRVAMKDSNDFADKYESSGLPDTSGYTYNGTSPANTYNTSASGILTTDTYTAAGYQTSGWQKTIVSADPNRGLTLETRLKVINSADSGTDINRGFWLLAGIDNKGAILSLFNDCIRFRAGTLDKILTCDNASAYHVYRIVVLPGAKDFKFFRDGELIVCKPVTSTSDIYNVYFGDPTTSSVCPDTKVEIDYVRVDDYAAIPVKADSNSIYPGHINTVNWSDLSNEDVLPSLAESGTGIVVFRNDDFLDISHGLSQNGSYSTLPANLNNVLDRVDTLGMKSIWWFSIRGALNAGTTRNNGNADPILVAHPEWFLSTSYWSGMYRYADMFSDGWKGWCLDKIESDIAAAPLLDGFAFDEPYFYNVLSKVVGGTRTTFARNGINFLDEINASVKSKGTNRIVIANFWVPSEYAFDFFDFTVQEGPGLSWVTPLTCGKSSGARGIGNAYSWELTLTHFSELYLKDQVGLGWVHQGWHYPVGKDKSAVNALLRFLGHARLLYGIRLGDNDITHLELELNGRRYLFLINSSAQQKTFTTRLKNAVPQGCTIGDVIVDTSSATTYSTINVPTGMLVENLVLPANSIYRVQWR